MTDNPIPVHSHRLANGLTVAVSPDNSTAMAAVNVLYDVGARDEKRSLTGLAHLFEHLMFGGSEHAPDFDGHLEAAGGRSNAWTSNDFTNFYLTLPAQNLATAFHLESDRMAFLSLGDKALDVQRGVVIEEFKQQCLDRPYGNLFHRLRSLVYSPEHPYSWPVIGLEPEHIARVSRAEALAWYEEHYCPSRAIIAVTGRVDPDEVFALAEHWFGDIAGGTPSARQLASPGFPRTDVVEEMRGQVPSTIITIAVPMDSYGTRGYHAADAITDLLAAGLSSRFATRLVHGAGRGIINAADASITGNEHEGLLLLNARLAGNSDADIEKARRLLEEEALRLCNPGEIGEREWQRMQNNFEATFCFGNTGYMSRASNLAMAVFHDEDINATVTNRRKLDPSDVVAEAEKLFVNTPKVTVVYRPA